MMVSLENQNFWNFVPMSTLEDTGGVPYYVHVHFMGHFLKILETHRYDVIRLFLLQNEKNKFKQAPEAKIFHCPFLCVGHLKRDT